MAEARGIGGEARRSRRSAEIHIGGECRLRCAVCDCRDEASPARDRARILAAGGERLLLRGATESVAVTELVRDARRANFADVVLRTSAVAFDDAARAAEFAAVGADAVLVPLFSERAAVHDRIAGVPGALAAALGGMRRLRACGLAIEIEIALLSPRLQNLSALVDLCARVAKPRRLRFYAPRHVRHAALNPPAWPTAAGVLAAAVRSARAHGIEVRLRHADAIPLCALRDFEDLYEVYAFDPRVEQPAARQVEPSSICAACVARPQCSGITPAYRAAHGEAGLAAYAERPPRLYQQRTTPLRAWTGERRAAAARAEIQVLRPTVNCNQDCTFCSANETSGNVWVSREEMMRAIARVARRGTERVSFSGGEPTLSRYLPEFVRAASRLGIPKVELITNAVLLDRAAKVEELRAAGLTHAFVSLHGHDEELSRQATQKIGDFTRTLAGIRNLVDAGVETAVNHVVNARNYPFLARFVSFIHAEFAGRVKISFALVTPQFKALDNIEVVPRLSEVAPALHRAMYRALGLGQPFNVGSRQGVPFCFLGEFRGWSDGIKQSHAARAEDAPQKTRAPGCDQCRFSAYCNGVWTAYAERYGLDELVPVPGPPLSADEVDIVRAAERELAWGVPMSFDDVAEPLRQRDLEGRTLAADTPAVGHERAPFVPRRSRPLRVLLVGTGRQAERLARAAAAIPTLSIDAVVSPHALQKDLAVFGDCPGYADVVRGLEDIRPEAMLVAAPPGVQVGIACEGLSRGVATLVEKPVSLYPDEILTLARQAAEAGVIVVPGHNAAFAAGLDELSQVTRELSRLRVGWARTPASPDRPRTWHRGALFETFYHLFCLVEAAGCGGVGAVREVVFSGEAAPRKIHAELQFGAVAASVAMVFDAASDEDQIESTTVAGSRYRWQRRGRDTTLIGPDGAVAFDAEGSDTERMLRHFADAVLLGVPVAVKLTAAAVAGNNARALLDGLAAAGAPFERPGAPRHVASPSLGRDAAGRYFPE